jgi:hypothetical protein
LTDAAGHFPNRESSSVDGWRYWLTRGAFAAAILLLALLPWMEAKGRTRGRRRGLFLALPLLGLLALIAVLI